LLWRSSTARSQGVVRPPSRHARNSGCGRAAETESAPRLQRQAGPKLTAGRNIRRIALAFEAGRDGLWLDLWRFILFRKIPEYPVSGTDGSNPSSSSRESCELAISRRIADCLSRSRTDTLPVHIAVRCPCSCSGDVRSPAGDDTPTPAIIKISVALTLEREDFHAGRQTSSAEPLTGLSPRHAL